MGVIIEVTDCIELQLRSSNVDGKGNWGSLWLVATDTDNGERVRVLFESKAEIERLIHELSTAKNHLAD